MSASAQSKTDYAPFSFETVFDASGHIVRSASRENELLTRDEVAALEAAAYQRGQNDAVARSAQATADAVNTLARLTQMLIGRLASEAAGLREDAVAVALAAGRAVADQALSQYGDDVVVQALQEAVAQLRDTPRLVVRIAPALEASLSVRLQDAAASGGFAGSLVVRADPAVHPGDVSLEWADGAIHLNRDAAFVAIADSAARWLATAEQEGLQLDLFSSSAGT